MLSFFLTTTDLIKDTKAIHYNTCLNQTNECNVGDVYIINVGTPHAYFAASEGSRPTVCNLFFDPKDILDGDYACSEHPKYCYGVFRKHGLMSYTMLTATGMEIVAGILECMKKELIGR